MESLRHGLRDLGYIEGKNIDMALRYADGDYTRLPALAEELVRLAPRVIVTDVRLSTLEVKKASSTIPIVSPFLTDPTGLGLATSDARPGGQVTAARTRRRSDRMRGSLLQCSYDSFGSKSANKGREPRHAGCLSSDCSSLR